MAFAVNSSHDELIAAQIDSAIARVTTFEEKETMTCCNMLVEPVATDLREKGSGPSTRRKPRDMQAEVLEPSIRQSWAGKMQEHISQSESNYEHISALNFILHLDGKITPLPTLPDPTAIYPSMYPSAYRISPSTITDLDPREQIRRAERFALGSMIYELHKGEAPYENLVSGPNENHDNAITYQDIEDEVQARYSRGEFPEDVTELDQWPLILSCWSMEFAEQYSAIVGESWLKRAGRAFRQHASAHPVLFGLQCTGLAVSIGALAVVPVLAGAGFAAVGPVAGSSAAAWQASIGAVQAGSLFAWCQSAAMGGAAVSGIIAAGAAGGSVVVGSTAAGLIKDGLGNEEQEKENLMKLFKEVCRTAEGVERGTSGDETEIGTRS